MWPKTGSELPAFHFHPELIFTWKAYTVIFRLKKKLWKSMQTCPQTTHLNLSFIFKPLFFLSHTLDHSLACVDLRLDLIWGLRCWANVRMFLSNKWRALERLWLSMHSAQRIAYWLHFRSAHKQTCKQHTHTVFLSDWDLIYVFFYYDFDSS